MTAGQARWSALAVASLIVFAPAAFRAAARRQQAPSTAAANTPFTYFIASGAPDSGYETSDSELARWAFEAWARSTNGTLRLQPTSEDDALVRLYWVAANGSTYGETRPRLMNGRRGAEVFVRPDVDALGADIAARANADSLWRDTIVYLTCLHELGHALGLSHTSDDRDIMYFFGYGGDIVAYFDRYRRQLRSRDDIPRFSGLSAADIERVRALR